MNSSQFLILFLLLIFASACATNEGLPNSIAENQVHNGSSQPNNGNADVIYVIAKQQEDLTWTFSVTVSHPDTGWEDYADGWDVVLMDGNVLKQEASDPFTRLLTHPHVDEQPFTRSQSGITIPNDQHVVTVRAHDLVDGYGGKTVVVNLDLPLGENFEVIRANPLTTNYLGLTNQNADGNRYVTGQIDLVNAQEISIPLENTPIWVVGVPQANGDSLWLVALIDGSLQMFQVNREGFSEQTPPAISLNPGTPPSLLSSEIGLQLLNTLYDDVAQYSSPISTSDQLAYIDEQGNLVIQSSDQILSFPINALQDGHLLTDSQGNLLLLSDPTTIYQHGVLGDGVEAQSITLIKNPKDAASITTIPVPGGQVIEGIAPIWVDVNFDGTREIIVTLSDAQNGAQLAVLSENGDIIALSSAIGSGYRWRHQIAAAPFGPNGEMEIVDVLTPHIGGVVEFFQLKENELQITAQIGGYTSHVIGSRNLDMALAADVDADGQIELLLPNQQLTALGAIQRTIDGAEVVFEIPLDDYLSTNIASIKFPDGSLAIAAGLDIGTIKVWIP